MSSAMNVLHIVCVTHLLSGTVFSGWVLKQLFMYCTCLVTHVKCRLERNGNYFV